MFSCRNVHSKIVKSKTSAAKNVIQSNVFLDFYYES